MASFPIIKTAFTGFSVIQKHPMAFFIWLIAYLLIAVGFVFLFITQISPMMGSLVAAQAGAPPDPATTMLLMQRLLPLNGLMLLTSLVVYPVMYAAMSRAVLRPNQSSFGFLRIGSDEILQLVLMLLCGVVFIGVEILIFIGALIVGAVIYLISKSVGAQGGAVGPILGGLAIVGFFAAAVITVARLCLASPITFATGKITLFGSWSFTKGSTWRIVAVGLVCAAVSLVFYIIAGIVAGFVFAVLALSAHVSVTDPASVQRLFASPAFVVAQALLVPLGAIMAPLWLTPPAEIYRRLTTSDVLADVF